MSAPAPGTVYTVQDIMAHQRNRFPVLLIDRIEIIEAGKQVIGRKGFTFNEWYFPGHFEDEPNVPGFVQIECLTQTFIMTFLCLDDYKGMKTNFVSVDNVKFKRKIIPGDVLTIKASLKSIKRGIAIGSAESWVDDEIASSGDFVVALPDILRKFSPK